MIQDKLTRLRSFKSIEKKLLRNRILLFLKIFFKCWIQILVFKLTNLLNTFQILDAIVKLNLQIIRMKIAFVSRIKNMNNLNLLFLINKLKILLVMCFKTPLRRLKNQTYLSAITAIILAIIHNIQVETLTKILDFLV